MKKGISLAVLSTAVCLNAFAQAQNPDDGSGINGKVTAVGQTRYMQVDAKDAKAVQYNVTIMGSIDFNGIVEVHGLVQTGPGYNVAFNRGYNVNSGEFFDDEQHLNMRRLFIRKKLMGEQVVLDLGSMGTRPSIARAGKLSDAGWIDGGRATLKTDKLGSVTITAGSLNPGEASAIERAKNLDFNYFEISVSQEVLKNLMIEAGVEVYNDETFLSAAGKYDIEIATGRVISLVSDVLVNGNTGGVKYGAGIDNVLGLFTDKFSSVKVSAFYQYTSPDIGKRGQLTNTFTALGVTGHAAIFSVQAPISKKYGLNAYASARITPDGSNNLYEVGVKGTFEQLFGKKKNKKKN